MVAQAKVRGERDFFVNEAEFFVNYLPWRGYDMPVL